MPTRRAGEQLQAAQRDWLTKELVKQSGGQLLLFFVGVNLGSAYESPSRGYGKAQRVGVALAQAESEGRLDAVLRAAATRFGIPLNVSGSKGVEHVPDIEAVSFRGGSPVTADDLALIAVVASRWLSSGQWPLVRELQRALEKQGARLDVEPLAWRMSPRLGYVEQSNGPRIVLRVAGLAQVSAAEDLLDNFVRAVRHLYAVYRGDDDQPVVTRDSLVEALSVDPAEADRIADLIINEGGVLSRGSSRGDDSFAITVADEIRRFRDVATVEDYLAVLDEWFPINQRSPTATIAHRREQAPEISSLHPSIAQASGQLFADEHFGPAVLDAFKAVEIRVRQMSSLDLAGKELMAKAFDPNGEHISLTNRSGMSGRSEQEGYRFLFMGAMQGIRNIEAHEPTTLTSRQIAWEMLAVASVLMRRLDSVNRR